MKITHRFFVSNIEMSEADKEAARLALAKQAEHLNAACENLTKALWAARGPWTTEPAAPLRPVGHPGPICGIRTKGLA